MSGSVRGDIMYVYRLSLHFHRNKVDPGDLESSWYQSGVLISCWIPNVCVLKTRTSRNIRDVKPLGRSTDSGREPRTQSYSRTFIPPGDNHQILIRLKSSNACNSVRDKQLYVHVLETPKDLIKRSRKSSNHTDLKLSFERLEESIWTTHQSSMWESYTLTIES